MPVVLVGLGHRARHGKDTLATLLHSNFPTRSKIYSLADDLKAYCRVHYGMTQKDSKLLQEVGQRIRQEKGPDFWIRLVKLKIEEQNENLKGRSHIAIIPDVRYLNEKTWIESEGGITIKVSRFNKDGTLFVDPSRPANHPSETELASEQFSYDINANDGDFAALERAAGEISKVLNERLG